MTRESAGGAEPGAGDGPEPGAGGGGAGEGSAESAAESVERAAEVVEEALMEALSGAAPRLGVVLGSGLGGLAERFEGRAEVAAEEVPGWPRPGVSGHAGRVVAGRLAGVPAVGLQGRVHLYEGHPPERVAFPIRVLARLGVEALFVSNAAGSLHRGLRPGELMLIADHLNLMWRSPLAGPPRDDEPRFPDMSEPYDEELRAGVRETALAEGVRLHEGVYAGMLGPSYETPAEIRMLDRLGADAVGMSTVPEVIVARASGIRCFGVSCLTNYAAGVAKGPLSHDEVLETTERTAERFQRLVLRSVERLAADGAL